MEHIDNALPQTCCGKHATGMGTQESARTRTKRLTRPSTRSAYLTIVAICLFFSACGVTTGPELSVNLGRPDAARIKIERIDKYFSSHVDSTFIVQAQFFLHDDTTSVAVSRLEVNNVEITSRTVGTATFYDTLIGLPHEGFVNSSNATIAVWGANGIRSFRIEVPTVLPTQLQSPLGDTVRSDRDLAIRWTAGEVADRVTLSITFTVDGNDDYWFAEITDDGEFVIPASSLARFDKSRLTWSLNRTKTSVFDATDGRRIRVSNVATAAKAVVLQ